MRLMKDSGIEWIGLLPASWRLNRMGSMFYERSEKVSDIDFPPLSVTMKGIIPQLEHVAKSDDHFNRKLVCSGDFAINSRSDRRNSCGFSFTDGSVSLINTVLVPLVSMNSRYYEYLFKTVQFADEYYRLGHGIVNDLWTTKWIDAKRIELPLSSSEEQQIIADYLDKKCAEIDKAIDAAKASIEEYKLYKKSVIFQAVTKGLDHNVPMKDSGELWLGSIPENWDVVYPKALFVPRKEKARPDDIMLTASQHYGMIPQDKFIKKQSYTPVAVGKGHDILKHVEPDDFVISMRSFQGGLEYCRIRGKMSSAYIALEVTDDRVNPEYFKWLLKSERYIEMLQSTTNLVRDGQALRFANIIRGNLPLPPDAEQERIASFLDLKCEEIDRAVEAKQQIIDELKAYKKSLIWEVVTGKREV